MIAILRVAASTIAIRRIDPAVRQIAVAAARAAAGAATKVLSAGGALDGAGPPLARGGLSPAEIEVLDAAASVPDDEQVVASADAEVAVRDALRATIRLVDAAAALRAERRAARRGVVR